jgi:serine/threonine protein kinase/Tol biopolymer transport system component
MPTNYRNALPIDYRLHYYHIQAILGKSRFGITYLALDTKLNSTVVIKEYFPNQLVIRKDDQRVQPQSDLDKENFRFGLEQFLKESRVLAQLKHPNIVPILHLFQSHSTAYRVMPYEPGQNLAEALKSGGTATQAEIMAILPPLLSALKAIHQARFLHLNIKPNNIYLRAKDNVPILLDFGAARHALGSYNNNLSMMGTPGYAPLEQYQSKNTQGAWTDIYALGAVLYYAISGNTPLEAPKRVQTIKLKNQPDPLPPATQIGHERYSKRLLQAIDWALEVGKNDRPQTVVQWESRLTPKPQKSQKYFLTSFLKVKLSLIPLFQTEKLKGLFQMGKVGKTLFQTEKFKGLFQMGKVGKNDRPQTVAQSHLAPKSPKYSLTPLLKKKVKFSLTPLFQTEKLKGRVQTEKVAETERPQMVAQSRLAPKSRKSPLIAVFQRREFRQSVKRIMVAVLAVMIFAATLGFGYVFYDEKRLAWLKQQERERIEAEKKRAREHFLTLLQQPSRQTSAAQTKPRLPRKEIRSLQGHEGGVCVDGCVAFSPDAQLLASGSWDNTIKLWEVSTGNTLQTLRGHRDLVLSIAWSPNGLLLASGSADSTIKLWEVSTGKALQTLTEQDSWVGTLAFSPDGQILAAEGANNTVKLWELNTDKAPQSLTGHENAVSSIAFSPDGRLLASASFDSTIKLWELSTGNVLHTLKGHKKEVLTVAFSPDGKFLASGDAVSAIKLWNVSTGKARRTLKGHSNWVLSVTFSPDGRTLASASHDYTIKLWNVRRGKLLRTLTGHENDVNAIAFSPDGKIFASGSRDKTIKLWQ